MLTSKFIRLKLISLGFLCCLCCIEPVSADSRPASIEEIQELFDLATAGPQRERFVADITSNETKWSREEIAAGIQQQNDIFPDMRNLTEAEQRDRTNAIARSHSGIRIQHVQEWYSGNLYRLDQTDEGMVSLEYLTKHRGTYKNSFVNIDDPTLSPYRSFRVDHELHDIQLSKTTLYAKNDLWRARGLENELSFPLIIALIDSKSVPRGGHAKDPGGFKIDSSKAARLQDGSDKIWHLLATTVDEQQNRTRFILRGRTMSLIEPNMESDIECVYEVGRMGQRSVCMEASLTNYTTYVSFFSKREDFDSQGFPHIWKRTILTPASPAKKIDVEFKEVELNPSFIDEKVFLPVFATNYIVSDVTSGNAKVLQNPQRSVTRTELPKNHLLGNRLIICCMFGLTSLWLGIKLLRMKRDKM